MNEIIISVEQFRKLQGHSTKRTVGQIRGEIDGLLYDLGAFDQGWFNIVDKDLSNVPIKGTERQVLVFSLRVTVQDVERTLGFRFSPVLVKVKKHQTGGKSRLIVDPEPSASWLIFLNLLRAKTDAAKLGFVAIEQELLSNVVLRLPKEQGGGEVTVGEVMEDRIARDRLNGVAALEDQRERRQVASDSVVVERKEPIRL